MDRLRLGVGRPRGLGGFGPGAGLGRGLFGRAAGGLLLPGRMHLAVLRRLGAGGSGGAVRPGSGAFEKRLLRLRQRQLGGHDRRHGTHGQPPHDLLLQRQDLRRGVRLPPQPDEPGQGGERGALLPVRLLPHRCLQQAAGRAAHGLGGRGGGAVRTAADIQQLAQGLPSQEVVFVSRSVRVRGARHILQPTGHALDAHRTEHRLGAVEHAAQRG